METSISYPCKTKPKRWTRKGWSVAISASEGRQPDVIAVLLIVCPVCLLLRNKQADKQRPCQVSRWLGSLLLERFVAFSLTTVAALFQNKVCVCDLFANVDTKLKLFLFLVICIKSLKCLIIFLQIYFWIFNFISVEMKAAHSNARQASIALCQALGCKAGADYKWIAF